MSILYQSSEGFLVCHERYLQTVYNRVRKGDDAVKLSPHQHLFCVKTPYMKKDEALRKVKDIVAPVKQHKSRKRKRNIDGDHGGNSTGLSVAFVTDAYEKLIQSVHSLGYLKFVPTIDDILHNNDDARKLSENLYRDSSDLLTAPFSGENNTNTAIIKKIGSDFFVFPEHSNFFCRDVHDIKNYVESLGKFDLILLDPPWWNKYIRRKKSRCQWQGYNMMYNSSLVELPLLELLAPGGIIAVWCTNSSSNLKELRESLFPSWGTQQVAQWSWLKLTQSGEPVCPFSDPPGKQPFEQLIFGTRPNEVSLLSRPENGKIFMSVPSAIHSHKPPITEMLKPYLPPKPRCLEIFARYLLPHWTSWGLEVLKLQHHSLFQESSTLTDEKE